MAQVNILSGIYTNTASDFRISYPRNLVPVPQITGISTGYLRPSDGIVELGSGPGVDRGAINWNNTCYRAMGTKLVSIASDGTTTILGDIGPGNQCSFTYSFDRLAVTSGGRLYYYANGVLSQVSDIDLGTAIDVIWIDGYFMTTDGSSLVVTELNDPFSVNPLKYGSSEVNPDRVVALLTLRDEVYAINRYTIEVFQNIGGDLFPFQRIPGAMMERGAINTYCATVYLQSIAFLGGGLNEAPAIWLGANGSTINISTREVDQILASYTEDELALTVLETRIADAQKFLYVHLPDQTLVYDGASSAVLQQPVWHVLTSSLIGLSQYRARNFVWCYNRWLCGDPTSSSHGYLSYTSSQQYGENIGHEFGTAIIYNGGNGAIFSELELVCLTGRVAVGVIPTVWTSYTIDGMTWSQEKARSLGLTGDTLKRINWYQNGFMRNWRCQKFRWTSDAFLTVSRLEMTLEALNA